MGALDAAVRQGKALYVGISSYPPEQTEAATDILANWAPRSSSTSRLLDVQPVDRDWTCWRHSVGSKWGASSSPRCPGPAHRPVPRRGPAGSRPAGPGRSGRRNQVDDDPRQGASPQEIAEATWPDDGPDGPGLDYSATRVTSTLIGASSVDQLEQNVATIEALEFSSDELEEIDKILRAR